MSQVPTEHVNDERRQRDQLALAPPLAADPRRAARQVGLFEPEPAQLRHPQPEAAAAGTSK
jgi:hypothetical protein